MTPEKHQNETQVLDAPQRRHLTPEYKLRILQEIDSRRSEGKGVVGEILRREGIYASQVASWRNSLEEVIANGLPEKKRGRKTSQTTCSHSGKSSSGAAHHRGSKKNCGNVQNGGSGQRRGQLMMAKELVDRNCCTAKVCETLSVPRSTFYRHRKTASSCRVKRSVPPKNKIGDEDRAKIFHILHDERFIDLCPREIVPTLADEGIYLGSIRSFYRVLAANNELCERRNIARHPKHCAPVLEANAPGEVWSWDITHIKGPWKGCNFYLYVMIDIYSRYVVGWMLAERENARRAQHFIREIVAEVQ